MSMLMKEVVKIDPKVKLVLDSSYLLSNEDPYNIPNHLFINQPIIDELFRLMQGCDVVDERERATALLAQLRFGQVTAMVDNGDIFYIQPKKQKKGTKKKAKEKLKTDFEDELDKPMYSFLSFEDKSVIRAAIGMPGSGILSCDGPLCMVARQLGIKTYSIRTLSTDLSGVRLN